jgi:hypothetical protein
MKAADCNKENKSYPSLNIEIDRTLINVYQLLKEYNNIKLIFLNSL